MPEQLSLFKSVGDNNKLSSTNTVEDAKIRAIQRYLNNAETEPSVSVGKYSPNGRKTEYYRLLYRVGRKVKGVHIPGGNVNSKLANYRKEKLQAMIDRGADVAELLAAVADYSNGVKHSD